MQSRAEIGKRGKWLASNGSQSVWLMREMEAMPPQGGRESCRRLSQPRAQVVPETLRVRD